MTGLLPAGQTDGLTDSRQSLSHPWNHAGFLLQGVSDAAVLLSQDALIQEFLQRVSLHTHTHERNTH